MTNRYEILEQYGVALFIEDGVLKSLPVGAQGVLEKERYKNVIDFEAFDTDPYYTDDDGEGMGGFPDAVRAAYERLRA
jgi:hypothetical protein